MSSVGKTYQQRLFADEELPLPLHDQIVRWVDLRVRNAPGTILRALNIDFQEDAEGNCRAWAKGFLEGFEPNYLGSDHNVRNELTGYAWQNAPSKPPPPKIRFSEPQWEPILKGERGGVVGALDLVFTISIQKPSLKLCTENISWSDRNCFSDLTDPDSGLGSNFFYDGSRGFRSHSSSWCDFSFALPQKYAAMYGMNGSLFGVTGVEWNSYEGDKDDILVIVEAKTTIRSAGELMRQINLYRSAVSARNRRFLVTAPRQSVAAEVIDVLLEQGVNFLPYQAN